MGLTSEDLGRDAAEVLERRRDPVEPLALALVQERLHEHPPRVAQYRDEEVDRDLLPSDPDLALAEVDLHLPPRRSLEPDRREVSGEVLAAAPGQDPLHRPDA